jgi:hypothetical protein
MSSRSVPIVLASGQVICVVVFKFLFKWKTIKLSTESELRVNLLLADVEVLHIKET